MSPPEPSRTRRDGGRMDAPFLGHETATPVRGVCEGEGFSSRVLRTISASSSGVILRGRPERGRSSSSSSTPPASYRSSHCVTVGLDTPTSRQIAFALRRLTPLRGVRGLTSKSGRDDPLSL